jgi:hypothetical protein
MFRVQLHGLLNHMSLTQVLGKLKAAMQKGFPLPNNAKPAVGQASWRPTAWGGASSSTVLRTLPLSRLLLPEPAQLKEKAKPRRELQISLPQFSVNIARWVEEFVARLPPTATGPYHYRTRPNPAGDPGPSSQPYRERCVEFTYLDRRTTTRCSMQMMLALLPDTPTFFQKTTASCCLSWTR